MNTEYTFPTGVVVALPLDDLYPQANQLVLRFDGGDDRIFAYDGALQQWRHVPDSGDVPSAAVLLVRRDGGGCGLFLAVHHWAALPVQWRAGAGRLPRLSDVTAARFPGLSCLAPVTSLNPPWPRPPLHRRERGPGGEVSLLLLQEQLDHRHLYVGRLDREL